MKYYICGIDVGIIHLGLSFIEVQTDENIEDILTVIEILLVDITKYTHNTISKEKCRLYHTNTLCDRVNHFLQEYKDKLDSCKYIFIERQPITGITSVEQLVYNHFRDKAFLVQPSSIHKHFGLDPINSENRKKKSVKIGMSLLHNDLLNYINKYERKHDICDSILIAFTGLYNKNKMKEIETPKPSLVLKKIIDFNKYKYNPIKI